MQIITHSEFTNKLEPILRQVFVDDDSFTAPLNERVEARAIVYPSTAGYWIEPPCKIMIEKWQNLLAQLEILENKGWGIWSEERLLAFEAKTGITLPADYKDFFQVFGKGMFGNYCRISLPNNSRTEMLLTEIDELYDSVASPTMDKISLENLVTNSLIFGNTVHSHLIFWDLRTYSERDRSYDIYFGDIIYADIHQVGRNFFEFVRDFCLGMKSYEVLPEWMRPYPEELTLTFCPFKSPSESELAQLEEERQQHLIWQKNIASGAVLKMAISYEKQGQLTEALLLHIQHFLKAVISGEEASRLYGAIARLQNALPEEECQAIYQAANFPAEQLLPMMAVINTRPSAPLDVEDLPEPDAEFPKIWQDFLSSFHERYSTILADSARDVVNPEPQELMPEIPEIYLNLLEATINSPNSNLEEAWSTTERSLSELQQKYPSTRSRNQLDENFQHLHLPPESSYLAPERSSRQDEIERDQMEQAIEEKNPYAFFRYLRTLRGHSLPVYAVKFAFSDRPIIASASADTTIKLWDPKTAQEICTLSGHTDAVISLATSPNGQILASGSADTTIKLWDLRTGMELRTFVGHSYSVLSLAITPDGKTLASASADNTIKLWDLPTGEEIRTLSRHVASVTCLSISGDGKILASGSADTTIKLWDLQSGDEIRTLNADSGIVFSVCFHPTTELLASSHGGDKTINLWNAYTGDIERTIAKTEPVASIAISPDGKTLSFSGGYAYEQNIGLLNLDVGEMLASFEGGGYGSCNHKSLVYAIAFSHDSQILASGSKDATVKLWGIPDPIDIR